jgi:hypothetical protein
MTPKEIARGKVRRKVIRRVITDTHVILGQGGHVPVKCTPGGNLNGGQLPGPRHGGYTPGGKDGQSIPPISIFPHLRQMPKNHSLQLDFEPPSVSWLCSLTVVEMKLTVLSGGQVEKVVRPFVSLAGGGGEVSVPTQGQPGATVRICWMKVTVVTAVTQGYVNAEPEMVVTLPVGVHVGNSGEVRHAS